MKRTLLTFFMLPIALVAKTEQTVAINAPYLSRQANYTISSNDEVVARGTRLSSCCCCAPTYYLYDEDENLMAKGVSNIFSLGAFFVQGYDLSIYDGQGEYLGCISGKLLTCSRAKYRFYNASGYLVATSYLNADQFSFALIDEHDQDVLKIASIQGSCMGSMGHLDVSLHAEKLKFDQRLLDIFNLFILDFRQAFAKKPDLLIIQQQGRR